jgi:hypothetical protein
VTEFALYREPTALDTVLHRQLKLAAFVDHSFASRMHVSFIAAVEFAAAALEFVILFIRDAHREGGKCVSPVVLLGLRPGENLFVEGTRWDARHLPAYIRRYPFWTLRVAGQAGPAVMIDRWWRGFSETIGEALFESDGKPAPRLAEALRFIESFDAEVVRTQSFCDRLVELDVLREMTAKVSLRDGSEMELAGFHAVDAEALGALPEASILEIHRSGMLGLIHAHSLSLGNMQGLVDRMARRAAAASLIASLPASLPASSTSSPIVSN